MTPQDISDTITNCLKDGMEHRTNSERACEALETLIPLLGYIPAMKRKAEYSHGKKQEPAVDASGEHKLPERIRLKWIESYTAQQKGELEEVKSLEKSLHGAISALQSLLKEYGG